MGQMQVWTCTTVLKSKEEEPGGCKGRPDMFILIFILYPKTGFIAGTVQKLKMGPEHPISTPHLRVYSPPTHAESTPPTIPENPQNIR